MVPSITGVAETPASQTSQVQEPPPLPASPKGRPIVLHFDINKTIIMSDSVKGATTDHMVNALLSEVCWGTWEFSGCDPADDEEKLRLASTWSLESGPSVVGKPGMVTYSDLLELELKLPKKHRQNLKHSFTEPGAPGESVASVADRLKAALLQTEGFFLIPSFYRLILNLHEQERNFRIIFRTFGVALPEVIQEFNTFCEGGHPSFPQTPPNLRRRTVRMPSDTGQWYRDNAGLHLALCSRHDSGANCLTVAHGDAESHAHMNRKLFCPEEPCMTLALKDYHEYWKKSGEADDAGKPLLISQTFSSDTPHHMFFDDNIERHRSHIVDARCAETGQPLPFSETQGIHLIRAEPISAIEDPDYFIKLVVDAEAALEAQLAGRTVSGLGREATE